MLIRRIFGCYKDRKTYFIKRCKKSLSTGRPSKVATFLKAGKSHNVSLIIASIFLAKALEYFGGTKVLSEVASATIFISHKTYLILPERAKSPFHRFGLRKKFLWRSGSLRFEALGQQHRRGREGRTEKSQKSIRCYF